MASVLGIDTGGTYTDGIVLDVDNQKIITKAKALTTHDNLTVGIRNCINNLNIANFDAIKVVSVSTTLATNAIVEGRGGEVGLLLIGHEPIGELPVQHFAVVDGGHKVNGAPQTELNLAQARKAINSFKGKVDAIAISGYSSVRNPEHELQVRDLVYEIMNVPVVCGHQLTTSLGFRERTVTAALNAKLIPIISDLIESVKLVLGEMGMDVPLMIVKGDGTLMSESLTREKPIETILSGPAASIIGATALTGNSQALVLDMGGTTTDIAIIQEGVPRVNPEGAVVGGWLTRVQAAAINTYGVGGDSYIQVENNRKLVIGPQRVWPLAVVADKYPNLIDQLNGILGNEHAFSYYPNPDCYMILRNNIPGNLSETENQVINLLQSGPQNFLSIAHKLEIEPVLLNLQRLVNIGVLARISLTPTDILHAKGTYSQWNQEASIIGAKILAKRMGKPLEEFLDLAMENIVDSLCLTVLESALNFEGNPIQFKNYPQAEYFINKILNPRVDETISCGVKIKFPIIAIGAPVGAYLPKVAEKLNTELIIPENAEVANAIGAATGKVVEKIKVLIHQAPGGGYVAHAPWERKEFMELEEAKTYAMEEAKKQAILAAEKAGATDYQLMVNQEDIYSNTNTSWNEQLYVETRTEVTAVGRPKW